MTTNHYHRDHPWRPGDDAVFVVSVRDRAWFLKTIAKGLFNGRVSVAYSVDGVLRPDERHRREP